MLEMRNMTENELTYVLNTDLRIDLMVEDMVIIELKSVEELKPVFYKQTKTYLKLLKKRIGLLVNFGEYDMKDGIHRIILWDQIV